MATEHPITYEPSAKRVRVVFNGETIADTDDAGLLLERGHLPVYYFPRADVRMEFLQRTERRTHCPYKGDASYWTINVGNRSAVDAVWSYETPLPAMGSIAGRLAFYWDKLDRWLEEDEEFFAPPRDPHHRVDVRASAREVRVTLAGTPLATSRRALFLFETGLPTRYYVPPQDVRTELLESSSLHTICPYKGTASYWSARVGERFVENAVWGYPDPLPECSRIRGHFCFDPEKVERIDVEPIARREPRSASAR